MALTLEKAQEKLEVERESVSEITDVPEQKKKTRRKTQLLLEFGDQIEGMNAKTDQIAAYGAEQWKSEFNRLGAIEDLGETNLNGVKLRAFIWSKIPNSPFKRFQEAFCKQEDFIIPELRIIKGQVQFMHKPNFNSVKACLADPDCVPDKLLLSLKLMDKPVKGESDFARLERKYAALVSLKKMWESAIGFDEKNQRMRIVHKPSEEVEDRYVGVKDPPEEVMGTILYSREYEEKKKLGEEKGFARRLAVDVHSSAYSAFRKTRHQDKNYDENEIPTLAALYNDIRMLNEDFDDLWTPAADLLTKNELTRRSAEVVAKADEILSACRESNKVRVYEFLQVLVEKIKAKRIGPSMAKMVGAKNSLIKRQDNMKVKNSFNTIDRTTLEWHIKVNEDLLKRHRSSVAKNAFKAGLPLSHQTGRGTVAQKERNVRGVMRGLQLRLPRYAAELPVRPFSTYIEMHNRSSDMLERSLDNGDKGLPTDNAILMHVIGKLQAANICVEELKCEISIPEKMNMNRVRLFSASLNDIFEQREIFSDQEPIHIKAMYEPVEHMIQELREKVQEAGPDIQSDPVVFKKFCKELRDLLDRFDLENVTRALMKKTELIENESV